MLKVAEIDLQRETALCWFWANLKPYDLSTGGPYFGFAEAAASQQPSDRPQIGGFGQSVWAPPRVDAFQALHEEFSAILPDDLIRNMGDTLGTSWMWTEPSTSQTAELQSEGEIRAALLATLESLAGRVRQLAPAHGQIGHNLPPDDVPITPEEQADALEVIEQTKAAVTASDSVSLKTAWSRFVPFAEKLGAWALKQADTFVTGIATEGGKALGKALPYLVLLAIGIWIEGDQAGELIDKIIPLIH